MTGAGLAQAEHDHTFGQDCVRPGERRTMIVILITATMMVVEIVAGLAYGSMALLADGLHMASHAAALSINAFAYIYARRHARDSHYTFGTGKVNALGGFAGAVLLALFAALMAGESLHRLLRPIEIVFNQAILVACLGLLVNGLSVLVLGREEHGHDHGHDEEGEEDEHGHDHHHDHNLRSAYLHVLADALTSVLAIVALVGGKFWGWSFMDPLMGVVGAVLVGRWSLGLLRSTSRVLLDAQAADAMVAALRTPLESDGQSRVSDCHVWSIGPGIYAAAVTVRGAPDLTAADYRARLSPESAIVHLTIEILPGA
ncbi:MAG: CDF family Co(II)/Ni(II) efflux transporter DmeF [Lentisphaerae bacterium]|nr:CDF family Co(II)/Ni(II) efflux transporter DmeF [Lentisphaerota bacterium]